MKEEKKFRTERKEGKKIRKERKVRKKKVWKEGAKES